MDGPSIPILISRFAWCVHRETVRKIERLHQWDVLRANKAPFAWGLEPRVPFLDKEFLDVCMSIDPALKTVGYPPSKPYTLKPRTLP